MIFSAKLQLKLTMLKVTNSQGLLLQIAANPNSIITADALRQGQYPNANGIEQAIKNGGDLDISALDKGAQQRLVEAIKLNKTEPLSRKE